MPQAFLIVFDGEPTEEQQKQLDAMNDSDNVRYMQSQQFTNNLPAEPVIEFH